MRRITHHTMESLYSTQATRQIEQLAQSMLLPHSLMARAGLAVAQLAQALAPHARRIWVACGPGNNGGDGLVAAIELCRRLPTGNGGLQIVVTHCEGGLTPPVDAQWALAAAHGAGVPFANEPPGSFDLAIDALLGIGHVRPPEGRIAAHLQRLQDSVAPVLCVDLPSALNGDTGRFLLGSRQQALAGPRHTLSLLTLKPGLFTADGRDQAGQVWFDDLGVNPSEDIPVTAFLHGLDTANGRDMRPQAAHKGSQGDVLVVGGQGIWHHGNGMTGAAVLAARAALYAGAGRVYLNLLEAERVLASTGWDPDCPALMFRHWPAVRDSHLLEESSVVCGCGGGLAVKEVLPAVLDRARNLVLDADGLNAVAADPALQTALRQRGARGQNTVLTPHPLEAARLLGTSTTAVMADRLATARTLSDRFGAVCVLKGSGSVISAPARTPRINPSGNPALATAGTGDVLAGFIGATIAALSPSNEGDLMARVADAVHLHGRLADHWLARAASSGLTAALTADQLARYGRLD